MEENDGLLGGGGGPHHDLVVDELETGRRDRDFADAALVVLRMNPSAEGDAPVEGADLHLPVVDFSGADAPAEPDRAVDIAIAAPCSSGTEVWGP